MSYKSQPECKTMLLVATKKQALFFISLLSVAFAVNFHYFATAGEFYKLVFAGISCVICTTLIYDLYYEIRSERVI